MDIVNAIAKARFGTAKPQCIQLYRGDGLAAELLCLETGQKIAVGSGEWAYYIVTGTATLASGEQTIEVPTGQLAATGPNEIHSLANVGEARLVVLATGRPA